MITGLKQNFQIFLKILPMLLIFIFVSSIDSTEFSVITWVVKILIAFLLIWRWLKKIKAQSRLKYFKSSFICTILLWIIIIALIVCKNEVGGIYIFLIGIFWGTGMVLTRKAINDSWTTLRKYNPQIKMDTEVHSLDEYFEIYSWAEHLEIELSELKKEASPVVEEALMQREAGKLLPLYNLVMIFFTLIVLWGTTWLWMMKTRQVIEKINEAAFLKKQQLY